MNYYEAKNHIVQGLAGSCINSFDSELEWLIDNKDITEAQAQEWIDKLENDVYSEVDSCSECGWWCLVEDLDEVDGELICYSCVEYK